MRWHPVLAGAEAHDARQTAQRIVSHLVSEVSHEAYTDNHARLIDGMAGYALILDYAKRCGLSAPSDLPAQLILDGMHASQTERDPSLYFGFAGLAWVGDVTGVWEKLGEDLAVDFDEQLAVLLAKPGSRNAYSLFRGLSGLGIYALQRMPRTGSRNAELIVQRLKEISTIDGDGVAWSTDGRVMASPGGGAKWFSMGMPQGLLAVISFLALASRAKIPGAHELLHDSARWLSAKRVSDCAGQCFPIGIDGDLMIRPQRLAWCNGDLPVALALLQAGQALAEQSWIETARQVVILAASLPAGDTNESSLCHGDAGIGMTFAFMYNLLGDRALLEASARWFASALKRRQAGEPYEGFRTIMEQPLGSSGTFEWRWSSSNQFLRGAGGIALALLSASEAEPPEWAAALMLAWNALSTTGESVRELV